MRCDDVTVNFFTGFALMSVKGSARNSAVCRGLPCSSSSSTKPVNPQVLEVLGVGPEGMKREADFLKPHPPKGKSRPMKSVLHQAAAPVRKLKESSLDMALDMALEGEMLRRILPRVPPSSPVLQLPTPPPTAMTPELLARRLRVFRMNPCH